MAAHEATQNKQRLLLTLALTSSYMVAEVVGGILTKSLALLADAGHMLTDIGGLSMSLIALYLASKPPTDQRSFGFMRAEILAAVANALLLFGVSIYVLIEAFNRFRAPPQIEAGPMLWVAVIGLLVNVGGILILRGNSNSNLNMRGAYFEVVSDLLSSIGVILAAAIVWATGWTLIDPVVSAGIGLFILPRTWHLLREATNVLLESAPLEIDAKKLRERITALAGVLEVHDLHVWSIASGANSMTAHVVAAAESDPSVLLSRIEEVLKKEFGLTHTTIQVEAKKADHSDSHR